MAAIITTTIIKTETENGVGTAKTLLTMISNAGTRNEGIMPTIFVRKPNILPTIIRLSSLVHSMMKLPTTIQMNIMNLMILTQS